MADETTIVILCDNCGKRLIPDIRERGTENAVYVWVYCNCWKKQASYKGFV